MTFIGQGCAVNGLTCGGIGITVDAGGATVCDALPWHFFKGFLLAAPSILA